MLLRTVRPARPRVAARTVRRAQRGRSMTPFTILHVCMGNICRSPMAERLTALALSSLGPAVHTHSVGTGGWHAGGPMEPGAARQVARRGGSHDTFRARKLRGEHVDGSDLVLAA